MVRAVEANGIRPVIDRTYAFEALPEAVRRVVLHGSGETRIRAGLGSQPD